MSRFFQIFIWILLLVCQSKNTFSKNDSIEAVVNQVLGLDTYQVSIFQSKDSYGVNNFAQIGRFLKKISREMPAFLIDINKTRVLNGSCGSKNSHHALNSDLYIMIEEAQNLNHQKMKNSLITIAESDPLSPRPKFLLVLIGDSSPSEGVLQNLFYNAWALKFLDFSVLLVNGTNDPIVLNYNPFIDGDNRHYNVPMERLFPDKLNNMNGHKIKTFLFNRPPHIEFANNSNEMVINGVNYAFLRLASENLHFTFDFTKISKKDVPSNYIFQKVENAEIDVSVSTFAVGIQLMSFYKRRAFLIGRAVREANMHLVVPILYSHTDDYRMYLTIILHSSITALVILVLMVVIKLCKLSSALWTPFYVFGLLFGVTVSKKPKRTFERLIYILLAVTSIKYSSDVFSTFSDDDVVKNQEITFDAYEEVKNPSLTIYMSKTYFQDNQKYDDEVIDSLKAHSKLTAEQIECYERLVLKKDCFCLNSAIHGNYMVRNYRDPVDNSPVMKIAQPVILGDYFAHIFPKNSPYVKKFDQKFQQILEAGLRDSIPHAKKNFKDDKKSKDRGIEFKSSDNVNNPLILFAIGCVLGILTFVLELISRIK